MSNIAEAKAQLEEGLFDSDSDNDSQQSSSDEDSSDDDTSSLVNLKPALKKGDRVVAAWWDLEIGQKINSEGTPWFAGKVKSVKEKDHYSGSRASKYGPIRVYNIDYDDGDKLKGVLDVFVCSERDYELLDKRNLRGVENDKDETSSDRYAKEIGWYKTTEGVEKRYATLYEAMKKADEHTIKVKKDVRKSDLNLPEEWELPKPKTKKRGRSKKVDNEDGNPVKKKKRPNMEDLFDHTGSETDDTGENTSETAKIPEKRNDFGDGKQRSNDAHEEESEEESEDESLASDQDDEESGDDFKMSVDGEKKKYIDVVYIQNSDRFRGTFARNKKVHLAGNFVLKADAAYARDELCRAIGITSRGFNFNTEKEYKDARAKERKRRGLSLDETGTVKDIFSRIETKRTKWNQIKERSSDTDDSSQSSSDDLPLMSMKTKRRRLASPSEMTTKSTSDYRGVTHNQNDGKPWTVSIFYDGEDCFVGKYDLESDAARVYDEVSAIFVSNDDPNFANESDHEEARIREAETLGLNLEKIPFQEALEKAQIYVHKLFSAGVNDSERAVRKRRSSSPFTPILTDCDMESSASPVENVNDSNKKIADLNEAMAMKWGRRLSAAGNLFIDSYQQNLCEMLGGCVDESSKSPIGTFVSISSFPLADGQESNDEDLDVGESTDVSPQNTGMNSSSNFGDKSSDDLVEIGTNEGTVENKMPVEQHKKLVQATHDNLDENVLEKKKPAESHEHIGVPANQEDDGVQEKKSGSQGHEDVDLSNDDKREDVKYAGVSKCKGSNRFRGNVWRNGKQKSVGEYVLKADTAHARDEYCRSFNLNRPLNFNTQEEYLHARAKEIAERGLTMDAADTAEKKKDVLSLSGVAAKLQKKKAEWDAESKKPSSCAPKSQAKQTTQDDDSSSDDVSLFSDTNDEVPSQDSAAVTIAKSNVTAETTPDLSETNLAKKPDELHETPCQNDGVQERKSGSQGNEKVDLSNDDKKKDVKYVGTVKMKGLNRFRGQLSVNGKSKSVGDYVLKVDAAHARDEYCRSFNLNRPLNFNTHEDYLHARAKEIAERRLTRDAADSPAKVRDVCSLSEVAARLQKKKAEWDAESKKSSSGFPTLPETKSQAKQTTQDDDSSSDDISLFSDANDEQDNFVPSQDSAAVTVAKSNVTAETTKKPDLSEMNLVQVTKKQEEKLEFPVGCPVLWKLQDGSLQKGKITSAWLNMKKSVSLVYGVQPINQEPNQMKSASELMFDTHCPVDIKSTDNNAVVEGEVLVSRTDGAKTLYTVLVKKEGNEFQLKHEVPFDQLSFRKVAKENTSASQVGENSKPSNNTTSMRSEQKSETKMNSAKEVQPRRLSSPEKEGIGHCDMSMSTSNSTISTRDSGRMSTPRGRSGIVWDGRSIDIELPDWFVSDNVIRDRLEYQLTGSPGGRRTIFAQIHARTNCTLKMSSHGSNVIRIETNPGKYAIDSLRKAKIELENFFLDYLNRDGCIGRLFYDLAVSCQYLHPQRGRSCVYQRNPWEPNEMGYMSVVELPYLGNDWGRAQTFHSWHLLSKEFRVLSRCRGCEIKVVDKRGRVPTKWTKPYVWVWGHKPGDVDDAVQILKDANREHANSCGCRLPR